LIDKIKVIKGLECCGTRMNDHICMNDCPYYIPGLSTDYSNCQNELQDDALALLKGFTKTTELLEDFKKRGIKV
jgi:hypothetical protein